MAFPTSPAESQGASPPQISWPAMPTSEAPQADAALSEDTTISAWALRPGDHVEVHAPGYQPYQAVVDDTMAHLHVAWVRELRCGERRMLSTQEHRFHRC
jgi:hypothetical protein